MKRVLCLVFGLAIAIAYVPLSESSSARETIREPSPVRLAINRYTTVALTDARADQIISDGVKLLKDVNGSGDVSCSIDLGRRGTVSAFSTGNGIINSQADYNQVCALPGRVHMVRQINYCDGPGSNIIGCSDTPGTCMVLVRTDDDLEGILWMHEYGHNNGLDHRNDPMAVMNQTIDNTCKKVNSTECQAYQSATFLLDTRASLPRQLPSVPVADFVRKVFVHGVPYEEASKFSETEVPVLLKMLGDSKEEGHWSNIVVTLGAIGDVRAVRPLLEFLTSGSGVLTDKHYQAKSAVMMSLGYLINKSGNREALDFLLMSLNPDVWPKRLRWIAPFPAGVENQRVYLTQLAIWGLALSGSPEAGNALRALKRPPRNAAERRRRIQLGGIVDEALSLYAKVVRFGLVETYKRGIR